MHPALAILGWLVALGILALAHRKLRDELKEDDLPLIGLMAAGLFMAQMLNFPVGGGTSGHLLGAALATFLLGPWAALLVMALVLGVQALLFGDGGITAFGLNFVNMGATGVGVAWLLLNLGNREGEKTPGPPAMATDIRMFAAAWSAVFLGSLACALELGLSAALSDYGIAIDIALPVMAGWHAVIGVGEGIISTAAVAYLAQRAPDMLPDHLRTREARA